MAAASESDENAADSRPVELGAAENQAKMMIVGAGARFLFYPTLLYNVVRNRFQPDFRWWDEIDQFLLLGAVPFPRDIPRLKDAGVHAVVTLNEPYETLVHTSLYKNQGINHLSIPTRDYFFAPSFADLRRAVRFIHDHAQHGKRTYVHCKAGRGRSTTVVICYLVEHRGMTPLEALNFVRSKRPRVLLAASQWKATEDYFKQLFKPQNLIITTPTLEIHATVECFVAAAPKAQQLECRNSSEEAEDLELDLDLPVLVTNTDLVGYESIEDAGLVGNELWKDVSFACRIRLVAIRNLRSASAWIGSHSRQSCAASCSPSTRSSCSSSSLPVCQSGMVN